MLSKTVTYVDFDGETRTETHYFNISKAELTQLRLSAAGGIEKRLQRIVDTKDQPSLIRQFTELLDLSYGVKSDDGRKFMKSPEILADFKATEAYSQIFMELLQTDEAASEFIKKVLPSDLVEEAEKEGKKKDSTK